MAHRDLPGPPVDVTTGTAAGIEPAPRTKMQSGACRAKYPEDVFGEGPSRSVSAGKASPDREDPLFPLRYSTLEPGFNTQRHRQNHQQDTVTVLPYSTLEDVGGSWPGGEYTPHDMPPV
jgi:hypothetical protein